VLLQNRALDAVCRVGRAAPATIPRLNRLAAAALRASTRVDRGDRVLTSRRTVRFTETEWALPRAAARAALRDLHALGARHEVNLPVEMRFVAGDEESFLSPAWGRDTVYLAAHAYRGMAWEAYFRGVQDIALAHDGRPHWGKRHGLDAAALAGRYPAWERFRAVRARLDPAGRFANPHVRRVLDAEGAHSCTSRS
jgi:FAD/FMN-containing dehydrogenase